MKIVGLCLLAFAGVLFSQTAVAQFPSLPEVEQLAPLDNAVVIPREMLVAAFRRAALDEIPTTRMLEGGEFNINIRHLENITPDNMRLLNHPDTIDLWIVQEGSGVMIAGDMERFISVGDMVFIPAGVPHGILQASAITWFNIRFPEHRNAGTNLHSEFHKTDWVSTPLISYRRR